MNKKKKFYILSIFLILVLFTQLTQAILIEENISELHDGGVYTYYEQFEKGLLIVTTIGFFNGSGVSIAEMIVTASLFKNDSFRLRVYDSETGNFVEPDSELGINTKTRKFTVAPNVDTKGNIQAIISVTNEFGDIEYASICIIYYYDEDVTYVSPDSRDYIDREIYEAEKRAMLIKSLIWLLQSFAGAFIGLFFARFLANRFWGAG